MIGIYRIKNLINNKCYYGSSKNIEVRWRKHKNDLNKGKHVNKILQRAWDKYNSESFIFEVVEECAENNLLIREQEFLDLKPEYNIGIKAKGGDNLTNNPNKKDIINKITNSIIERYKLMTDEEKKEKHSKPMCKNPNWKDGISYKYCKCGLKIKPTNKTCINCRDKSGEKNPFFGKQHSEETKKKLSELRRGKKPTNMKQVIIDDVIYESLAEASRKTGIPSPTILWRINSKNKKYENYLSN